MPRTVVVKRTEEWEREHTFTDVPDDATDEDIERMADDLGEDDWESDLGGNITYEIVSDSAGE